MRRFPLWLAALLLGMSGFAFAIGVHRLAPEERIVLDGNLDEPAWQRAPLLDKFWEISPSDKIPAKVRTEARFAYDRQALYVAIRAFDPDMYVSSLHYLAESLEADRQLGHVPDYEVSLGHLDEQLRRALKRLDW